MPLRCTRRPSTLFAFLLALVATPALATTADVEHVTLRATGQAQKIGISGTTAIGCVPKVVQVQREGNDLAISLAAASGSCKSRRLPYHLEIDPATALGTRALPADVYRVHVYLGSGSDAHLAAFALVDTTAAATAPLPESGFWWTQATAGAVATPGTGMSIELQDNRLAASLLGFSETGAPAWYFGSATLSGRVAHIPLVELGNGEGWFAPMGAQPDVAPGPSLDIDFLSPTRADAYLVRQDDAGGVQMRVLSLSRAAFATGPAGLPWVGRWVLVPEEGETAKVFDFASPSSRDADSFRLVDSANDAALDCRLIAGTQQAETCTLTSAATVVADFDQVGLDRFAGHGAGGAPVQLLRVPR